MKDDIEGTEVQCQSITLENDVLKNVNQLKKGILISSVFLINNHNISN